MSIRDRIHIIKGDITKQPADVIVNAANTSLLGGGGVDGAIHRAGGPAILEDCRKIIAKQGGCKTGEAVITTAGHLPAKFVIHTVGPVWNGGKNKEEEKLKACYTNTLSIAEKHSARSVAFPNISTGIYHFPKEKAAVISLDAVIHFLQNGSEIKDIFFVCFDDENYRLLTEKLKSVP